MDTIFRYIRRYYCEIDKVDQTEIVNQLLIQIHSKPEIQLLNEFHSFNTINNEIYESFDEQEAGIKRLLESKVGIRKLKENSILPFNKIMKWTLLKYHPFHELLILLNYPILIYENKIWWGELKDFSRRYWKIYELFNKYEIDVTDGDGLKENLIAIKNLLIKEKLIDPKYFENLIKSKITKEIPNTGKTTHEIDLKNKEIVSSILRNKKSNLNRFN